ncbi:MAG: c-type cytochrome [Mariprofundaceae bacterium]
MKRLLMPALLLASGLQAAQAEEAHRNETTAMTQMAEEPVLGVEEKCRRCHDFGSEHILGPSLAGVFGRKAGSSDYKLYSDSLKNADFVWNEENLSIFFRDTKKAIKELTHDEHARTAMPPLKISDAEIDEAIAFLKTLR